MRNKVLIIAIFMLLISSIMGCDNHNPDGMIHESMIGTKRENVDNYIPSQREYLQEFDDYDLYTNQELFGMECDLIFYYDENDKISQISYSKTIGSNEKIDDYQKNINKIIKYYSKTFVNTKDNDLEINDYGDGWCEYLWVNNTDTHLYSLSVNDEIIQLSVQ